MGPRGSNSPELCLATNSESVNLQVFNTHGSGQIHSSNDSFIFHIIVGGLEVKTDGLLNDIVVRGDENYACTTPTSVTTLSTKANQIGHLCLI